MSMRERDIEAALVSRVKGLGGIAYKWVSPAHRGVPDRLVLLPGGVVCAVEVKAKGKHPTTLQARTLRTLDALGLQTAVVDSIEAVAGLLDHLTQQCPSDQDAA